MRERWSRVLLLLLGAACIAASVRADDETARKHHDVNHLLAPIRAKHDLPCLAAAVVRGDELVAIGAVGVRERGSDVPITTGDRFHIGSCSKAMTATMIATLVEQGDLKWETTVGEVFRGSVETIDPKWNEVTLEHLLTNSGGAPANLDADGLWGRLWRARGTPTEQRMMLVEGVLKRPPECEPGEKHVYSNTGFAIAGAMAERVTGRSWENLMRERLFEPLGMKSAGFGPPGSAEIIDEPRGHDSQENPKLPGPGADNPAAIGPAGTVHCTLEDWAKFVALHLQAARGTCKLLACDSFERLHRPGALKGGRGGYAMGWIVTHRPWARGADEKGRDGTGRVLTHAGSNTMWFCVTWLAPERDFAVLIACNQGGDAAAKACDEAAWATIQWTLQNMSPPPPMR